MADGPLLLGLQCAWEDERGLQNTRTGAGRGGCPLLLLPLPQPGSPPSAAGAQMSSTSPAAHSRSSWVRNVLPLCAGCRVSSLTSGSCLLPFGEQGRVSFQHFKLSTLPHLLTLFSMPRCCGRLDSRTIWGSGPREWGIGGPSELWAPWLSQNHRLFLKTPART